MATAVAAPTTPSRWWLPLIQGIIAILLGILFFINPVVTSVSSVLGLGCYWLILGIIDLVRLFWDRTLWGWKLTSGILGILAGGLIMSGILGQNHPLGTAFAVGSGFSILLGILTMMYGIMALFDAFRGGGVWAGVLGGFAILFGLIVLVNPLATTLALPWSLGILLLVCGVFLIVAAFRVR